MNRFKIYIIGSLIAAIAFTAPIIYAYVDLNRKVDWQEVNAVLLSDVVEHTVSSGRNISTIYNTTYYYYVDGVCYMQTASNTQVQAKYADYVAGQTITILYDPADPSRTDTTAAGWQYWVMGAFGIASGGFLITAVVLIIVGRRY